MRREDLDRVVSAIEAPMAEFMTESRVRTAILLNHSGQILTEHGFPADLDIANVAALAAATNASAHAVAQMIGAGRWVHLHHAGQEQQLFLAPFRGGDQNFVLVAIFDRASMLGLVQLFFQRMVEAINQIPELATPLTGSGADSFERDLEAGLERLLSNAEDG